MYVRSYTSNINNNNNMSITFYRLFFNQRLFILSWKISKLCFLQIKKSIWHMILSCKKTIYPFAEVNISVLKKNKRNPTNALTLSVDVFRSSLRWCVIWDVPFQQAHTRDKKKLQKTRFKLHPLYLPALPKLANWSELSMIDS